ncbi:MAG: hypothetical protein E7672_04090 [Ruminococcaceae bacterium]|nr:hypothetical protein [Oscillospiraceae bacterium]
MIDISIMIAVIGVSLSVATFFVGRTTAAKNIGRADGELKADIKYIKTSIEKQESKLDGFAGSFDDVKLEIEKLKGRLNALEQKVKILHGGENI